MVITRLEFPLAKAEYLLTRSAQQGEGGDKKNYWQNLLGFTSAEAIRQAILAEIRIEQLRQQGTHPYGHRYVALISVDAPLCRSRPILTIWLVPRGETFARFITAIPYHKKEIS